MKRYNYIIPVFLMLFPLFGLAQQKIIKKGTTAYNFSEIWVWEYTNTNGIKGEMAIYREPKLNYWLLTPDDASFLDTDEMSLWFILKPNGEVLQAYQEGEEGSKKELIIHHLIPENKVRIPHYWKSTGKTKKFGNPDLGFQEFIGKEFKVSYEKTNEHSIFYLSGTTAFFGTLALFNNLNIDAKLPIRFPIDIPGNLIPLSEHTEFVGGGSLQYAFKYISHTEYGINLSEFTVKK